MKFKSDKQRKAVMANIKQHTSQEDVVKLQRERMPRSMNADARRTAQNTFKLTDADGRGKWINAPNRFDIEGLDDKRPSTKKLREIELEAGELEDIRLKEEAERERKFTEGEAELIEDAYDQVLEMKDWDESRAEREENLQNLTERLELEKKETFDKETITSDFKVDASLINKDLARHAHSGTSFDPELRSKQEIEAFEIEMKNTYKILSERAKTPEQKAILNEEMQRYQENYAKKWNELLSSKSRIISPMITGPANFPVRRNQKANDAYHNKYGKFMEWNSKARGSISRKIERHEKQRIMEDAGGEVALMKQKLKKAEDHQQEMKDANKIIRKKIPESERVEQLEKIGVKAGMGKLLIETGGYETYQMTNNNANIKRMKERVKEMEAKEATPTSTIKFSGGEIIDNNQEDRVQIFFDEKPDTNMRTKLKGSGWRWSPSNGVWQRKRTNAALHSAKQITGE